MLSPSIIDSDILTEFLKKKIRPNRIFIRNLVVDIISNYK